MPSLHWDLDDQVRVVDFRRGKYVLLNRRTGAWCVTNRAGVAAYARRDGAEAPLPAPLESLADAAAPPEPERPWAADDGLLIIYKLTDACNYRCSYCYDRKAARPKVAERRDAAIREALDLALGQHRQRVCVLFHGGEPLLEFDEIRDLVESYRGFWPHQLRFSLQTNLSLLGQAALDFLTAYRFSISVSVDGTVPEANQLRVLGGWEDPYELILGATRGLNGLAPDRLSLLITVGGHNAGHLPQALLRMQADGFVSAALSFMQEVNRSARAVEPAVLCGVLKEIVALIAEGRLDRLALWTLVQWVQQVAFGRSESMCLGSPCGAGRSLLTVFPSGEIGPCDSIFDPTYYSANLTGYLAEREASGPLSQLLARRVTAIEPCVDCDVRPHCNGTCPGNVVLEKGELTGVAAHECAFHYAWIKELIWLLSDARVAEPLLNYCARHIEIRRRQRATDFGD